MSEFEEIAHSGGKLEFRRETNGVSKRFSQATSWPLRMFQVCVSLDGKLLDIVPFGGIGQSIPYPRPSILAWVISDRHGMFGRKCPKCNSYFRTNWCGRDTYCPYCGYIAHNIEFTTANQLEFITAFCNALFNAREHGDDIVIDLDALADQLHNNTSPWVYTEEEQQNQVQCGCGATSDILGEYGGCPRCGKHNWHAVVENKLVGIETQFQQAVENLTDRHEREVEWEKLTRCVSEFEALANDIRRYLLTLPATPRRKQDLGQLSFQRILQANDCFNQWYGFEILEAISPDDRRFLNIMFNRRHVFTHNAGKVDQEYLNNTSDTSVRLNQIIRLRSREVRRLIPLIRQAASNLIRGCESIT